MLLGAQWHPVVILSVSHLALSQIPDNSTGSHRFDAKGWGQVEAMPERDTDAYFRKLRQDYKFRLQDGNKSDIYSIDLRIDPCRDKVRAGGNRETCCMNSNVAGCQHYSSVEGGEDMQIAYFQNAHVVSCRGTVFESDPNCGTYIEMHQQNNPNVLADVRIDADTFPSGYRTVIMPTHRLCMGKHEIWWVVRTRSGPYVQRIQPFDVTTPTCDQPNGMVQPPSKRLPQPEVPR
eukprot:gnl/TRDRNA2_/TRDRNA2_206822_c0_seq1.p1 gnl/TRDRNA2_/TRDRNA2_206822_c0~~gnl/TRDRNA2_/TRDRNA2_206822_c0_seq1.p1  ORF type:complete len:233 (+),score=22.61 gnl/TRDRNA2_/TRDRNA2_206822_c0_seq1:47-745(+)